MMSLCLESVRSRSSCQLVLVWPVRLLGHGDVLIMDGQYQDEFLHCTDPWPGTGTD